VKRGTLTEGQAAYGLVGMSAIVDTLARMVEAENQPSLFWPHHVPWTPERP
jgi:hypothetical protein